MKLNVQKSRTKYHGALSYDSIWQKFQTYSTLSSLARSSCGSQFHPTGTSQFSRSCRVVSRNTLRVLFICKFNYKNKYASIERPRTVDANAHVDSTTIRRHLKQYGLDENDGYAAQSDDSAFRRLVRP